MQHKTHSWKSSDGLDIFGQYWQPETTPKALICIVHGMGEHSGRYPHFVEYFVPKGYAVFALDHRGHGKSGGQRGHMPSYDSLMNDMDKFMAEANVLFPDTPKIMYGHSMGGNVAANYAIRRKPTSIKGLLLSSPYFRLAFNPPAWKVSLGKFMAGILPSLSQPTGLDASTISRDTKEVEKYKNDPLVHDKMSAAFFVNISAAGEYAIANANQLAVPALVVHGDGDKLTAYSGSEAFVAASNGKATFKGWPGRYHETQNDLGKEEVFAFEEAWFEKILSA
jgi:alpha-beta hydrolase superfamily lysophospholipase